MNENIHSPIQLPTSFSIKTLQQIVRNCQRNEKRLQELERYTRHERKNAERLLRETHQTKHEYGKQTSDNVKPKQQQSVKFFISLNDDITKKAKTRHKPRRQNYKSQTRDKPVFEQVDRKKTLKERQKKSTPSIHATIDHSHRVRFNMPENNKNIQTDRFISCNERKKSTNIDIELDALARRCEDLLSRLHTQVTILDSDNYHSRQEIQQSSKKKHEQLSEDTDQLQQGFISEIQRRNYLRKEILRIRLQQCDLLQGRTNTNELLKMIDT
jgi:hypothetical protein